MNRRSFLCAAPAVGLAFPLASFAEDTPILALFRKWDELYQRGYDLSFTEDEVNDNIDEIRRIELEMMALPVKGLADFAAKVAAYTNYGDFGLTPEGGHDLIAEAKALLDRQH